MYSYSHVWSEISHIPSDHSSNYVTLLNIEAASKSCFLHMSVCGAIFILCSHTYILFCLTKTLVSVKICHLSFCVLFYFICALICEPLHFLVSFFPLFIPIFVFSTYQFSYDNLRDYLYDFANL